jgi:hypothetical protein
MDMRKGGNPMKRWWPILLVVVAVVVWLALDPERREAVTTAIGLSSPTSAPKLAKPICSSAQVPAGDCIPQWEADLPPDPGEAGKATIAGIITNSKGVRDDVYRYIWYEYPNSERAREALFQVARASQIQVITGADLSKEEARKLVPGIMKNAVCYSHLETQEMLERRASDRVKVKVTNTPERWLRYEAFNDHIAHQAYPLGDDTPAQACGFDPEALPN